MNSKVIWNQKTAWNSKVQALVPGGPGCTRSRQPPGRASPGAALGFTHLLLDPAVGSAAARLHQRPGPRAPPASWVGGARGQPQREFPCRRAALHARRSPAARVRAGAEGRRLRDRELRAAQHPAPAGAAGSVPQRSPPRPYPHPRPPQPRVRLGPPPPPAAQY